MANILKQGQKQNLTKLNLDYDGKKEGEDQVKNYLSQGGYFNANKQLASMFTKVWSAYIILHSK